MSNWASAKLISRAAAATRAPTPVLCLSSPFSAATTGTTSNHHRRLFSTSQARARKPSDWYFERQKKQREKYLSPGDVSAIRDLKAFLEDEVTEDIPQETPLKNILQETIQAPAQPHKPRVKKRSTVETLKASRSAWNPEQERKRPHKITLTPREGTNLSTLPSVPNQLFPGDTLYSVDRVLSEKGVPDYWLLAPNSLGEEKAEDQQDQKDASVHPFPPHNGRMHSFVQVVNTPTADCPGATLLLHFDKRRYIFGHVADATQRVGISRGAHFQKVADIFLTGPVSSRNTGGLLGMVLTMADVRKAMEVERGTKGKKADADSEFKGLHIHGGKNLTHMLASGRLYVLRQSFPVRPHEILDDPRAQDPAAAEPDYSDDCVRVWNVPLFRASPSNPRKRRRSITPGAAPVPQEGSTPETEQELRMSVVKAMFESDWALDKLQEIELSKINREKAWYRADGKLHLYEGPRKWDEGFQDMKVFIRRPWPAINVQSLPPATQGDDSMCYIVKEQPRRGKFLPEIAASYGVPKFKYKILAEGTDLTLDDGTVVKAASVMAEPPPPGGFAVIDVRDRAFLDSLLARPEWSNPEIMSGVKAIYWILDTSVVNDPRLGEFMHRFSDNIKHIIMGDNISKNEIVYEKAAISTANLNKIDPERFPLPFYSSKLPQVPATLPQGNTHIAQAGEKLKIAPTYEWAESEYPEAFDPKQAQAFADIPEEYARRLLRKLRIISKGLANPEFLAKVEESEQDIPQRDTEIIPLGTGSCLPSLTRNVSSTLLRIPGWGTCLLDCGESTLGQMRRMFGFTETDQILRNLRFIYISHLHADHHLGTRTLLARLAQVQSPESPSVKIICPIRYASSVQEGFALDNLGKIEFVTRQASPWPRDHDPVYWDRSPEWISENLGLAKLSAVYVEHCHEALAAAFTWPSGLKIAYSGDCRPSMQAFTQIGRDAHLLIHEATFNDDMQADAFAKKHSTFSEAARVAKKMRARRLLLTHFSQRYPDIQEVDGRFSKDEKKSSAAESTESDVESEKENGQVMSGWEDEYETASESESEEVDEVKAKVAAEAEAEAKKKRRVPVVLFAFDQMRVKLGEFKIANRYLPAIRTLMQYESLEEKKNGGDGEGGNNCEAVCEAKGQEKNKDKQEGKKQKKNKKEKKQQQQQEVAAAEGEAAAAVAAA